MFETGDNSPFAPSGGKIEPHEMASILTTESIQDLKLKVGDQVELVIKAIHVLPVRDRYFLGLSSTGLKDQKRTGRSSVEG
jgi:hypothetical protein